MTCTLHGKVNRGPLQASKDGVTYTEVYIVKTDAPNVDDENEALVCLESEVAYGDQLGTANSYAQTFDVQISKDLLSFTITVGYAPFERPEQQDAPWDRPAIFTRGATLTEIGSLKDNAGNLIRNSANDPFEDVVRQVPHATYEINKCYEYGTFGLSPATYVGSINNATWNGAARTWMCVDMVVKEGWEKKWGKFDDVSIKLEYNPLTWRLILLDEGLRDIVSSKKVPIIKGGSEISEPWPLNGSGVRLAEGSTSFVWKEFDVCPEVSFSVFNIT